MPMRGTVAPVSPEDRHHLIDALRGFALAGVLLANLGYLCLYEFMTEPARAALPTAAFDAIALKAMEALVNVKAITVFSLLFGLGFAIQLERAQARDGGGGLPRFLRRLFWLLVIGVLHSYFLWWGDILMSYALVGLLLVLFRRAPDAVLLWGGLFVALLLPGLIGPWMGGWEDGMPSRADIYAQGLQGFLSDSWTQALHANIVLVNWTRLTNWTLICFILGRFLLGYWAGRRRLLQRPRDHLPLIRRIFWGGLTIALLVAALQYGQARLPGLQEGEAARLLRGFLFRLQPLALGIAYAAGFVLLCLQPFAGKVVTVLAPVGRMALTHYLVQSIIGIGLFYGIGLGIGPYGGVTGWWLAWAGIFAAQIVFSHWWLARFRYGPCEWAWRSLTYGRLQPMRLRRVALAS